MENCLEYTTPFLRLIHKWYNLQLWYIIVIIAYENELIQDLLIFVDSGQNLKSDIFKHVYLIIYGMSK